MIETCMTRPHFYIKNVCFTIVGCNLFFHRCDHIVTCSNHGITCLLIKYSNLGFNASWCNLGYSLVHHLDYTGWVC